MPFDMLTPFCTEMRHELTLTLSNFKQWASILSIGTPDDPRRAEALENYKAQIERIGQTAGLIGLSGLETWCAAFQEGLPRLLLLEDGDRLPAYQHLILWPSLMDDYLREPAQLEASMALAKYMAHPAFTKKTNDSISESSVTTESTILALIESLTAPPVLPEEFRAQLAASEAPVSISEKDISLVVPENADRDVYDVFLDEAPGNVEQFSHLIALISLGKAGVDELRNAKRIAHSFKGSANIVGIRGIATLGHHTEDILEYLEKNPAPPPRSLGQSLIMASDCLAQMVGYLRGDEAPPNNAFEVLSEIVSWANKIKSGDLIQMADETQVEVPISSPPITNPQNSEIAVLSQNIHENEVQATLRVPVKTVDEIFRLVGEMTSKISQLESHVSLVINRASALLTHNSVVHQQISDIEKIVMLRGLSIDRVKADSNSSFDPLEMDRYNELHGLTRSLVEGGADTREITDLLFSSVTNLRTEISQQLNINKELQFQVIATRLAPVNALAARLTRNIRQTCQQTGKQAKLILSGGEIQVDGDVLNKLADPLLHILRNAIDHGIELPEDRIASGKPVEGEIRLDFSRQGSGIVVTIRDDGRGLDYDRIRAKAIEQKLIDAKSHPTHPELARLILLPGFSTRDQVSEISGRGVGMDVVATRLASIKGTVELFSEPGKGCEVILRFQASLVTQHTLLVEAGKQIFAIPIHYIREAFPGGLGQILLTPQTRNVSYGVTGDPPREEGWQFVIRDEKFPICDLTPLTGYPSVNPSVENYTAMPKILVRTLDGIKAVLVERLIDSRSVMVKNMGKFLPHVHGISGVTLLGDGTLAPLLNIPELLASPIAVTSAVADLAAAAWKHVRRILVVDDSLSVRKGLVQMLQDAAYEVKGAVDGMDAIRIIKTFNPHLICTDLEMPNMNGLELTQHIRLEEATRHIPIIMITSRSTEKHREQAMQVGVNIYLTKPYTDADLLQKVQASLQTT